MSECRNPGCTRDSDGRFCSTECEVRYDHLKADAKEARLDAEAAARDEWV